MSFSWFHKYELPFLMTGLSTIFNAYLVCQHQKLALISVCSTILKRLDQVRDLYDCYSLASFYCDKEHDDQKQLEEESVYFALQLLDHSLTEGSESRKSRKEAGVSN